MSSSGFSRVIIKENDKRAAAAFRYILYRNFFPAAA